jgi:hypothetical protein
MQLSDLGARVPPGEIAAVSGILDFAVWRRLQQRLDEPSVRLKSQYPIRLYQWAKDYVAVDTNE